LPNADADRLSSFDAGAGAGADAAEADVAEAGRRAAHLLRALRLLAQWIAAEPMR